MFFGLKTGVIFIVSYWIGITAGLLSGHINSTSSIYNNPQIAARMVFIIAVASILAIVASVCLDMLIRYLSKLAYYDTVTNLPNRLKLEDSIRQNILADYKKNRSFAIVGIKVLNYNRINAMMGTDQGDILLASIAGRLRTHGKAAMKTGRWGGSLFIAVIDESSYQEIVFFAKRLLDALCQPYIIENRTINMLFTIGISRYPEDAITEKQLFGNVISLLDRNKNLPDEIIFFNEEDLKKQQFNFSLIEAMNRIDLDRDLTLGYQPKVHMTDGSCTGAEVLLRWTDSARGTISPSVFIPLAEQTGMIRKITRWVIRRALSDICSAAGKTGLDGTGAVHAVNLSVMDLKERGFY